MNIYFEKYHGAGNDFIILDVRHNSPALSQEQIAFLCDRRTGVGADGLIMIGLSTVGRFKMSYYNADGKEGSLCGNGSRCAVAFAHKYHVFGKKDEFEAIDGIHKAMVVDESWIEVSMADLTFPEEILDGFFINTGSPHFVKKVKNLRDYLVKEEGISYRYNGSFEPTGTNVNFIEQQDESIAIRTYERGVENETLACGTGITAAAAVIAMQEDGEGDLAYSLEARGGTLKVRMRKNKEGLTNVWLCGPVQFVFRGMLDM